MILIWDRLAAHRSGIVQRWLVCHRDVRVEFPGPPYAPELNPVEYLWAYLKRNLLPNLAVTDLDILAGEARRQGRRLQRQEMLLRSFLAHSPLFLRLK